MLKIDWNDKSVPKWAKYAAIDSDLTVCFFAAKPKWTKLQGWHEGTDRQYYYTSVDPKKTLQERPEND